LPRGVHNLGLLLFKYTRDSGADPSSSAHLAGGLVYAQPFKVYAGTATPDAELSFSEWSAGPALPGLSGGVALIDPAGSNARSGWAPWRPGALPPGQRVTYTVALNNPGGTAREYCLYASLDYRPVPPRPDGKPACGIVGAGRAGRVEGSLTVPAAPGPHFLQVIRVENPLMKASYLDGVQGREREELSRYSSTERVILRVTNKPGT
jgi:hypothetical protein